MVEVPLNTAYMGSFLEHQVGVSAPRVAVIDPSFAQRFVDSADACRAIERFYVLGDDPTAAIGLLRDAGWEAQPFAVLLDGDAAAATFPAVTPRDLGAIFFTCGTTGPSARA